MNSNWLDNKSITIPTDPVLIGGWPLKSWEDMKAFLISYSMYSEAAMIRWVMMERDSQPPKGGDGGTPETVDHTNRTAHEWRGDYYVMKHREEEALRQRDTALSTIKSLKTRIHHISKMSDEYRESSIEQAKLLGEARDNAREAIKQSTDKS